MQSDSPQQEGALAVRSTRRGQSCLQLRVLAYFLKQSKIMSLQKKKDSKIIPVAIDTTRWIKENFDDDEFPNSTTLYVAFRTIGSMKREHWMNRLAADITKRRGSVFPAGRMCHAEIILPISEGKFVKASVIKKSYDGTDENGKIKWKKGCVHCKVTQPSEWKQKYVFLTIHASRKEIKKALEFYMLNNGQDFNHIGYYANLVVPGGIGVRKFEKSLLKKTRAYFCTEFVITGLQALASVKEPEEYESGEWQHSINQMNPATSNPNSLYDALSSAKNVYSTNPLGKSLDVDIA
jgi:hypothetical protein